MRKYIVMIAAFLLLTPLSLADIAIETNQQVYSLGNKIKTSASVFTGQAFEGLFRLTLSCEKYSIQYYLIPISLEPGFRTAIDVPDITAAGRMMGKCKMIGELLTNENSVAEKYETKHFKVAGSLIVLLVNEHVAALPSETIKITGIVNEASGNNLAKGSAKISLGSESHESEISDGKFDFSLKIPEQIKSGKHEIVIAALDTSGNKGESSLELDIAPIPTKIEVRANATQINPGEVVEIAASLYDQAGDLINSAIRIDLASPEGTNVFVKESKSNEKIYYEFSQHVQPGPYLLTAAYNHLSSIAQINASEIRLINIQYGNETIIVQNMGNVPFQDKLTFIIQNAAGKFSITKDVSVDPAKLLQIDLSQEVPFGIYDIILNKSSNDSIQDAKAFLASSARDAGSILANSVTIHDNRPVYKKIAGGFSHASGALVGTKGMLTRNPSIASLIIIILVGIIVIYYGRRPLMKLIRREKDSD